MEEMALKSEDVVVAVVKTGAARQLLMGGVGVWGSCAALGGSSMGQKPLVVTMRPEKFGNEAALWDGD
ncbi:hypothetical protein E2C01_032414 [Portunus trituberculatus]|uniref:Uncharacterized protein n=1 Tax=Portunus trituberculatus TaxID=210409 RepID=A0A5B7F0V7_PORTR|nr:hypothetical protein [Portunus trituberculatus]